MIDLVQAVQILNALTRQVGGKATIGGDLELPDLAFPLRWEGAPGDKPARYDRAVSRWELIAGPGRMDSFSRFADTVRRFGATAKPKGDK